METKEYGSYMKVVGVAITITAVLTILVLVHYNRISKRSGSLVIPAGNTYLGPNAPDQGAQITPTGSSAIFTAPDDITWREYNGRTYPYSFSAPATLPLKTFDNDKFDIYAIDCCGVDPGSNVLVGVDYKADPKESKMSYVQNWWHQFGGLKSVASIDQFTNSKGLKGYKAKYVNAEGETPNLDVFFEIPGHPEYVIHMASGTLDPALFTKIIDTVNWKP